MEHESKKVITTRFIVRAGIFSALSALLYIFVKFSVPFLPSFLEFHFDEIPAFIASFAYGPLMGIVVLVIKTLIKLPFTQTLCVGELADLIYSLAFILPGAFIYKRHRNIKAVFLGLGIGLVCQLATSLLINVYVMIPFYAFVMGFTEEGILSICQLANPNIIDVKWSLALYGVLPFNALKDVCVIALTFPTYKLLHNLIDKIPIK